jgi:hypothetical protein
MGNEHNIASEIDIVDAVALHLIRGAFVDLAGAFARIDTVAAEAAVNAVAGSLILSLSAFREETRKRLGPNDRVADGVGHLIRKTVSEAKEQIAAARKTH